MKHSDLLPMRNKDERHFESPPSDLFRLIFRILQ